MAETPGVPGSRVRSFDELPSQAPSA
jgi:hypothetical protein